MLKLTNLTKPTKEGFTIVETLIVLAIAALIIIIVLIAVPDLQRTARNTDIRNDASNVASGIQNYESNNDGALPALAAKITPGSDGSITFGGTGSVQSTAHIQASDTIYTSSVSGQGTAPVYSTSADSTAKVGPGVMVVMLDGTCPSGANASGATVSYNSRSVAIFYPVESGSGGAVSCLQE